MADDAGRQIRTNGEGSTMTGDFYFFIIGLVFGVIITAFVIWIITGGDENER